MDGQYDAKAFDGKGHVNFYAHRKPTVWADGRFTSGLRGLPLCAETNASIYRVRTNPLQTPLNFWGRKTLRMPGDDSKMHVPGPMDGVYRGEEHVPIMRGEPIYMQFH